MNSIATIFQNLSIFTSKKPVDIINSTPILIPKDSTEQNSCSKTDLPEISLSDVANHDDFYDCWIVIYDRVYNVTEFLNSHPGGENIIMDYAGRDATLAFRGTGHSKDAIDLMNDYLIGELPENERIFRTLHGKLLSSDIPV